LTGFAALMASSVEFPVSSETQLESEVILLIRDLPINKNAFDSEKRLFKVSLVAPYRNSFLLAIGKCENRCKVTHRFILIAA